MAEVIKQTFGSPDRIWSIGYFDKLSNGINDIPFDTLLAAASSGNRVVGPLTIYLRTTGNDSTGDGTSARPFATFNGFIGYAQKNYPNCKFTNITISLGNGDFTFSNTLQTSFYAERITVIGQGAATRVIPSGAFTVTNQYCGFWQFRALSYVGGYTIQAQYSGVYMVFTDITWDTVENVSTVSQLTLASYGASMFFEGNHVIKTSYGLSGAFVAGYGGNVRLNLASLDITDLNTQGYTGNRLVRCLGGNVYATNNTEIINPNDQCANVEVIYAGTFSGSSQANVSNWIGIGGGTLVKDAWSTVFGVAA